MSAVDTAFRVIEWAMTAGETFPPPLGDIRSVGQLANPPSELTDMLAQMTALTCARLRLSMPPLDDDKPLGLGSLIIAAGIGVSGIPELGRFLFQAVSEPESPVDWFARHGIIAPALRFLTEELADDCRLCSPLTGLLNYPAAGQENRETAIAVEMLNHSDARQMLTRHLAKPVDNIHIRKWRSGLLDSLRVGNQKEKKFVLDIYEAAMIHHKSEVMAQIRKARSVLNNPSDSSDPVKLNETLSIAEWWGPLWFIERENLNAVRERRYLDYEYREGLALFRLSSKLTGKEI